jgi:hypothetical protein
MSMTDDKLTELWDRPYTASQADVRALIQEVRMCRRLEDAAAEVVRHLIGPTEPHTFWVEAKLSLIAALAAKENGK